MIDLLVYSAVAVAVTFVAAWFVSPAMRRWMEQPKYAFQTRLNEFERRQRPL